MKSYRLQKLILFLGGLECLIVAFSTLIEDNNVKKGISFSFSAEKLLAIFFVTLLASVLFFFSASDNYFKGIRVSLQKKISENLQVIHFISIILCLVGILCILSPSDYFGKYSQFFEKLRFLLVVILTLPFQFFAPTIFTRRVEKGSQILDLAFSIFLILGVLLVFILISKIGITPDTHFWNVAGVPLTLLQLVLILLICYVFIKLVELLFPAFNSKHIDIMIAITIYLAGIAIWSQTPLVKHFFALRPAPPSFEYFPYSDARNHDLGAISILNGYGINFRGYTDKPLYMVFLAGLHLLAQDNYNQLSLVHMYFLALMLPTIFWLGRSFHSREFGIILSLTLLIRQRNSIALSHLLASTNPRILTTEPLILLGIILISLILFFWFNTKKETAQGWGFPLLAGGIFGTISLVRLNPLGLLPSIIVFVILVYKKQKKILMHQMIVFFMGFAAIFTPWLLIGRDINGTPYVWVKIMDMINVRYHQTFYDSGSSYNINNKVASTISVNQSQREKEIPLFIINHTFHNIVTSFLILPDSFMPNDQDIKSLIKRPYFDEKLLSTWDGSVSPMQLFFFSINISFLSIGLGWSWRRWQWGGVFPIIIFITYALTLGFARTSGSRYIVPIDWIICFYYALGLMVLIDMFSNSTRSMISNQVQSLEVSITDKHLKSIAIITILFLSLCIPIAQLPTLTGKAPNCSDRIQQDSSDSKIYRIQGKILYPYQEEGDAFSFTFLVCDKSSELSINTFKGNIHHGQAIWVDFLVSDPNEPQAIFLRENSGLVEIWRNPN